MLDLNQAKDLALFARANKIQVLEYGTFKVVFSGLAFSEPIKQRESATGQIHNDAQDTSEDVLYHSA